MPNEQEVLGYCPKKRCWDATIVSKAFQNWAIVHAELESIHLLVLDHWNTTVWNLDLLGVWTNYVYMDTSFFTLNHKN